MKLTSKYQTVITRGFSAPVSSIQNPSAHGAVCHTQCRYNKDKKILMRKVNSNGKHIEVGDPVIISQDEFSYLVSIGSRF